MATERSDSQMNGNVKDEIAFLRSIARVKQGKDSNLERKPQVNVSSPTGSDQGLSNTLSPATSPSYRSLKKVHQESFEETYVTAVSGNLPSPTDTRSASDQGPNSTRCSTTSMKNVQQVSFEETYVTAVRCDLPSPADTPSINPTTEVSAASNLDFQEYYGNPILTPPVSKRRSQFQVESILSERASTIVEGENDFDEILEKPRMPPVPKTRTLTSTISSKLSSSDSSVTFDSWITDDEANDLFDSLPKTHGNYELMKVAKEMYSREYRYVQNLRKLMMIKQSLENGGYSVNLFKHVEVLTNFHEILLKEMRDIFVGKEDFANIYKPFLGPTMQYLNVYKGCIHDLQQGLLQYSTDRDKDSKFVELIHLHVAGKEDLSLISHVSRHITFYPILLKRLVDLLPDESEAKVGAEKALKQVTDIVKHANEHVSLMLASLQKCRMIPKLRAATNLPSDGSVFMKKGEVQKNSKRTETRSNKRKLYLFSDILYVKAGDRIRREIPVSTIRGLQKFDLSPEKDKRCPYRFRIQTDKGSLDLIFVSEAEMNSWKLAFEQVMPSGDECSKSTDSMPNWWKDEVSSMCMQCMIEFTVFNRRHHCRSCGSLICDKCSIFTENSKRESRMCLTCYQTRCPNEFDKLPDSKKRRISMGGRKSSMTPSIFYIKVKYERFDADRRTKDGEYFCCISGEGKLSFSTKPRDPQPKIELDCTDEKVFLCPPVIVRTSNKASLDNNCIVVRESNGSVLHLLTLLELDKKIEFLTLLQQSAFNCQDSLL